MASMSRNNYHVFLSFRGPDSRHTIISHLYNALHQKGLYVFKDTVELELGKRRSDLFEAIEGSQVAIVTFSMNYARSKWCLDELHKIMECKDQGKLTVLPIFYHVSPGEVRLHMNDKGEKGCYQKAMEEMETRYGKDSEMIKRWRKVLYQGGDLIRISLDGGQDEGSAIREIVETVLKLLNRVPLEVAKHPVGIDRNLKAIRPLLHIDPHANDVYMVGLLGQGGVGKTTLAKAICNDIANKFDSWCFLPNVREKSSSVINGLEQLQETLLQELLGDKNLKVSSVDAGKGLIKERLRNKRVLVILDDVDASNQLDALAGNSTWFGKGSRIIITTRDQHVLASNDCIVYPVELLEKEEARTLFLLHAFHEKQDEVNIDSVVIDSMVDYAGKLPLALVVLGAYLVNRSQSEWEGKLNKLKKSPDGNINSVLKISFDGLEDDVKEIFLDVACFFRRRSRKEVMKILNSCGFESSLGINILVERCLITVVDEEIDMHDLVCAMGQSIARDDRLKRNEIPSRIWDYEDLVDILSKDWPMQERQALKGVVPYGSINDVDISLIKLNELKGFPKLRLLILFSPGACPHEPITFPRELRWLQWLHCSASSIEFEPSSKLVHLNLQWGEFQNIKGKECFKLEDINISNCQNLMGLDECIGSNQLSDVPSSLISNRIKRLNCSGCIKLKNLPAIKEENKFLEMLNLSETSIRELPDSFCNLTALKELFLINCSELTTIPSSIYKMRSLEELRIYDCLKLSGFPQRSATNVIGLLNLVELDLSNSKLTDLEFLKDPTCFETLKKLNLSSNDFVQVPACISQFKNLEELRMEFCKQLIEVSELPNVHWLSFHGCQLLKTLPSLHTFICQSPKWFTVDLSMCHSLDTGYLYRSLQLERVRGFVGAAEVLFPGEDFPDWVNFHTMECSSRYRVSLSRNMSEDDLLGLVLFIILSIPNRSVFSSTLVMVGGSRLPMYPAFFAKGVHSCFMYIPRRRLIGNDPEIAASLNWRNFTLDFSKRGIEFKRWGMRLLCKQEQDDHRISVRKDEDDKSDSSGSEYESAIECDWDAEYESAQSEG